eukprot:1195020-Prorocentrum_minimum.AAC.1
MQLLHATTVQTSCYEGFLDPAKGPGQKDRTPAPEAPRARNPRPVQGESQPARERPSLPPPPPPDVAGLPPTAGPAGGRTYSIGGVHGGGGGLLSIIANRRIRPPAEEGGATAAHWLAATEGLSGINQFRQEVDISPRTALASYHFLV